MVKALSSSEILGISETIKTFASDNQTVAKAVVNFIPKQNDLIMKMATNAASLTQADVGSYFNMTAGQIIDYTTKSTTKSVTNTSDAGVTADPLITKQFQCTKFLTSSL